MISSAVRFPPYPGGFQFVAETPPAPPSPLFRFDCTGRCPLGPLFFPCEIMLRQAIVEAVKLARLAERRLLAKPRDATTVRHFKSVFGHDPAEPTPWPRLRDSGTRIAFRYRLVAEALLRANTLYRCDQCPPPAGGGGSEGGGGPATGIRDLHAVAVPPNTVLLCPSFWQIPEPLHRAAVILHEMFHLRGDPCFTHASCETRRTSSYCYEVFPLLFTRVGPDPLAVSKCAALPL